MFARPGGELRLAPRIKLDAAQAIVNDAAPPWHFRPKDTPKPSITDQNAAQIVQPPSNAEAMQDEIPF